jgi:diguanylate cyclase (GGDEF)-like protein
LSALHLELGTVLEASGDENAAQQHYTEALHWTERTRDLPRQRACHLALTGLYEAKRDYEAAFAHQSAARTLELTLFAGDSAQHTKILDLELRARDLDVAVADLERDQTEQKHRLAELTRQSNRDSLTGTLTPKALETALRTALETAQTTGQPVVFAQLDLDGFKRFRDLPEGHVGRALVQVCAQRLEAALPHAAQLGRTGDDSFGIALHLSAQNARAWLEQALALIAQPVAWAGTVWHLSASAGYAEFPTDGRDTEELLAAAEAAMLRAKRAGRSCVRGVTLDEARSFGSGQTPPGAKPALTNRERTVLALLVDGQSNKGMAATLDISPFTVRHHVSVILKKLGASSRTEAALIAVRGGWFREGSSPPPQSLS